uniref:Uncharacterized protein n=1 Tax=Anguilla anguilla TaxID=7936 RepID=A0A0E9W919_ANGAN
MIFFLIVERKCISGINTLSYSNRVDCFLLVSMVFCVSQMLWLYLWCRVRHGTFFLGDLNWMDVCCLALTNL